jgi:hypothetical protein
MVRADIPSFAPLRTLGLVAVLNQRAFVVGENRDGSRVFIIMQRIATKGEMPQHTTERFFKVFAGECRFRQPVI